MVTSRALPFWVLGISVVIVSTAGVLIRGAQAEAVPSLSIAFWRLAMATAVLMVIILAKPAERAALAAVPRRSWWLMLAAGFFLALHFASWISSLAFTSVASSTALVTTNPVWIALISWLFFRERPSDWLMAGIGVAMLGSLCIFIADANTAATPGRAPMVGNLLALIGSLTVCGYLLIGRRLATQMPI